MVKRFMQARAGEAANTNRYAPEAASVEAAFTLVTRKAIGPDDAELAANPRARSAKLRVARRTAAMAGQMEPGDLGMPMLKGNAR